MFLYFLIIFYTYLLLIKMKKKKKSINQIDMNYEKPKQINIFNIKFKTNE